MLRTIAVTRLFEEQEITRDNLWEALRIPAYSNLGSEGPPLIEWRFDLTAGATLLAALKKWDTFNKRRQAQLVPQELDGLFLMGHRICILPTEGFRIELRLSVLD